MSITYAFVDTYNFARSASALGCKDIDYGKLYSWLIKRCAVSKVFIYAGLEPGDIASEKKFEQLKQLGYELEPKK